MDTILDLCFLCSKDYNCVLLDKKMVSQVEYLLPEITIIKLGIPLRICSICDGALCAFSEFKQSSVESSRRLEARIKGAQGPPLHTGSPPVVHNNETLDAKPEKIEEIFIQEEYVEETPLDTNKAFLDSITLSETIRGEPHNQLQKDRVSQNIQMHTDTNADNIEEILIKEEQMEDTPEDKCFYNDILKEEYDESYSMNDDTNIQLAHNTEDKSAALNTSEEVQKQSSVDSVKEILDETDGNCRTKKITDNRNNEEQLTTEIQINKQHQCNVCKKMFIFKHELNRHVNLHRVRNHPCLKCKRKFYNNCQLNRHIELHCKKTKLKTYARIQVKESFSCSLCKQEFKNKTLLGLHMKLHCKICGKSFTQTDDLTLHVISHSEIKDLQSNIGSNKQSLVSQMRKDSFSCSSCNKEFNNKTLLDLHMKLHTAIKDLHCKICEKSFTQKEDLTWHMRSHSGVIDLHCKDSLHKQNLGSQMRINSKIKNFQCEMCDKTFNHKENLSKHMKIHCEVKDFHCDICGKSFMRKEDLTGHMITHSGVKDFHCNICGKSFTRKEDLTVHMITHSGVKDLNGIKEILQKQNSGARIRIIYKIKKFKCEMCDKIYKLKENLTNHMKTHSEVKVFQCEICEKTFQHKENLKIHMKIHSDVRDYQCEICGKSFRRTYDLTRHLKAHSEVRDLQCKVCDKTFKERGGLNKHIKIHTGIKDYQCEICEKSFMLKCQLTSHMKMHSEMKDFHCVICKKSFTHKCSLINHMKYHSVME